MLRRIQEVPFESVEVSRPSSFRTMMTKKPVTTMPLLKFTCQSDRTCTCSLGICLDCDGHFFKRTKVMKHLSLYHLYGNRIFTQPFLPDQPSSLFIEILSICLSVIMSTRYGRHLCLHVQGGCKMTLTTLL